MSTTTTNYGISKPDDIDLLGIQNANMDIIDTQMKTNADNIAKKQDALTFDYTPTAGSKNPVTSEGIKVALDAKQTTLTFDATPTEKSTNPVTSGGIYCAMALKADESDLTNHTGNGDIHVTAAQKTAWTAKQDALTFDAAPTANSTNPVTSGGVYTAMSGKQSTLTFDTVPTASSANPCTSGGIKAALDNKAPAPIIGTSAPTISTVGVVGQFFINTIDGSLYECTAASGNTYVWKSAVSQNFKLLKAYTSAGTYTFDVPTGITELGGVVIGGGGSGATLVGVGMYTGSVCFCTGGGSGHQKIITLNGSLSSSYPVVVGAGGAAASITVSNSYNSLSGNNGGSSSFAGVTATGGIGGNSMMSSPIGGATGGQGSSGFATNGTYTPAMGEIRPTDQFYYRQGDTNPTECINPFAFRKGLIAGGAAGGSYTDSSRYHSTEETAVSDDYGLIGSSGAATSSPSLINSTATKGTSYGCGGGASVALSGTDGILTSTSAAGADGAVLIYGR